LPELYVRNCSVYVTRRSVIERGALLGPDCRGYLMPRERSLDINDNLDLLFAEFLFGRGRQ
jgi:CMP-N,N'-diacetyllegionaminic acid synthase